MPLALPLVDLPLCSINRCGEWKERCEWGERETLRLLLLEVMEGGGGSAAAPNKPTTPRPPLPPARGPLFSFLAAVGSIGRDAMAGDGRCCSSCTLRGTRRNGRAEGSVSGAGAKVVNGGVAAATSFPFFSSFIPAASAVVVATTSASFCCC